MFFKDEKSNKMEGGSKSEEPHNNPQRVTPKYIFSSNEVTKISDKEKGALSGEVVQSNQNDSITSPPFN
ncbi:hypothetical protein [Legionella tunisiensis]|uniref:hypothetical protein n=1 Tax=Legionella tunisiensis TaxID=1034944 RepID=UPI00036D5CD7|nr:hypothetical protein [Legionella tunisiensis]